MEEKVLKLEEALCEVRKAHKLINDYQNRIGDLAKYIRVKLGFDDVPREIWGEIHYFDLGWGEDEKCPNKDKKRKAWHVAIIPIIDTKEFNTDTSESLLLFYFSVKCYGQKADVWIPAKMTEFFLDQKNMKSPLEIEEKQQTQYIFSFPLSSFADKEHTDKIIRNICEDERLKKLGIKFNINKK